MLGTKVNVGGGMQYANNDEVPCHLNNYNYMLYLLYLGTEYYSGVFHICPCSCMQTPKAPSVKVLEGLTPNLLCCPRNYKTLPLLNFY